MSSTNPPVSVSPVLVSQSTQSVTGMTRFFPTKLSPQPNTSLILILIMLKKILWLYRVFCSLHVCLLSFYWTGLSKHSSNGPGRIIQQFAFLASFPTPNSPVQTMRVLWFLVFLANVPFLDNQPSPLRARVHSNIPGLA